MPKNKIENVVYLFSECVIIVHFHKKREGFKVEYFKPRMVHGAGFTFTSYQILMKYIYEILINILMTPAKI